jgi:hypothetical protein
MRQKKSIAFISINDPDSGPFLSRKLIEHPDVVKGAYRIQRYGRERMFSINDNMQYRYFNWYYTKKTDMHEIEQIRRFLLFDRSGKLLYASPTDYLDDIEDSVKAALVDFQ